MTTVTAVPIVNLPSMYVNGYQITNDGTTPNTILNLGIGQCRDSTNSFDITLSSALRINTAVNGLNGLDTGTVAASTTYALYIISDPVQGYPTASLLTLASNTQPLMPYAYGVYRLIGYVSTDVSAHIIPAFWSGGNSNNRTLLYSSAQQLTLPSASTSAVNLSVTSLVPPVNNTKVNFLVTIVPAAASNNIVMKGFLQNTPPVLIIGQVAGVQVGANPDVYAQLSSGVPVIYYQLSSASMTVALYISSYNYSL